MRDLTSTLLAAQKKPDRLPYVEAKVYDFEQGIKRLEWTRLYEGSEPDNHHGIAFDGQGSMYRIRAETLPLAWQASTAYSLGNLVAPTTYNGHKYECTTAGTSGTTEPAWPTVNGQTVTDGTAVWTCRGINLYRQKVTSPGEASDYSQWVVAADDCYGPCAIAASGAKVYIFYRTTGNVLWKYYSHNYGDTWSNAQLVAIADVQSLSASWWGTGDIVVCFALYLSGGLHRINGITLDTTTQDAAEHEYTLSALGGSYTYGVASTYGANAIDIIFGGKETSGDWTYYGLYRTQFSDTYHFLAPQHFLTVMSDQNTIYQYPSCHRPTTLQDYEALQLTAVENFSATTPYHRPLISHLTKGAAFSENRFVEPRPFIDLDCEHGLQLSSTTAYWWLTSPSGVWRALRAAASPIDLTPNILAIEQRIHADTLGWLSIVLDNSQGQYATPPLKGSEVILKLGYRTSAGNEASDANHYSIDRWQYESQLGQSTLTLHALDAWALADNWTARYTMRWNYTSVSPHTVWHILAKVLSRFGILLWNNPNAPRSDPLDNFYPQFYIRASTQGDTALRTLLAFVTDALIQREALMFTKDIRDTEASCYEYKNEPGYHAILKGEYAEALLITHTQVSGTTTADPPEDVRAAAFDWVNLLRGIDNLRLQYDPNLEKADLAPKRAAALLKYETLQSIGGQITVPTNCGQELYDVITVSDPRCGISARHYRVHDIITVYDSHKQLYQQKLTLAAL